MESVHGVHIGMFDILTYDCVSAVVESKLTALTALSKTMDLIAYVKNDILTYRL